MNPSNFTAAPPSDPAIAQRAEALFRQQRDETFRSTDRLFARLMIFQWISAIILALWVSPRTWAGMSSQVHLHVWLAVFLGGAITLLPVWAAYAIPGTVWSRHLIAIGQSLMSALLIHLTGGRAETHFHVFGSLVILSFYRDWRVLIPATLIVGIDHFVRGIYWPYSAYGVLSASPWRSIEHAAWVAFEDVFLVISCLRGVRNMRAMATRTAEAEYSEERFRQIAEHIQEVFWMTDPRDNRLLYVSPAYAELWGRTEQELHTDPDSWMDAIHPEDRERVARAAKQKHLPGGFHVEYRIIRPDGSVRWIRDRAFPIQDAAGEVYRVAGIAEDITVRKHAENELLRQSHEEKRAAAVLQLAKSEAEEAREEAERANLAKSEFLSRMSHELRTPLNAILGFGQLLELDPLEPKQSQSVQHILKGGRHLLGLINEVLDIARIEAGKLDFSLEAILIPHLLDEATALVTPLANARKIRLVLPANRTELESCYALADLQRTKQVLLNLLSNAIKYNCDGGEVAISCRFIPRADAAGRAHLPDESPGLLRISVSDTGAGIAEADLPRLFMPFERLGAEALNIEGSGIGLALSKRIIEAIGGAIFVESVRGRGSTFSIELPAALPPMSAAHQLTKSSPADEQSATATPGRARRTVLQIEDNLANRQVMEQILQRRGDVDLLAAMQGQLGLDLAREHRPDLILLDLHLPDLPGAEVLARMRADLALRDIPVVVISADATEHQQQRLLSLGARAYLTKPFELTKLMRTLDEVLLS